MPQYVLGTMSPYPMVRKVIEINHMAPRKLLVTSWLSWYLQHVHEEHTLGKIYHTNLSFHSRESHYCPVRIKKNPAHPLKKKYCYYDASVWLLQERDDLVSTRKHLIFMRKNLVVGRKHLVIMRKHLVATRNVSLFRGNIR